MRPPSPPLLALTATATLMAVLFMTQPKGGDVEVINGVDNVPSDWLYYVDSTAGFALKYPPDWVMTQSGDEVQWWDEVSEENSVKVVLVKSEDESLEKVRDVTEAISGEGGATYRSVRLNELEVLIRTETGVWGESESYFYQVGRTVWEVTAYFYDDDTAVREQAQILQQSLRSYSHNGFDNGRESIFLSSRNDDAGVPGGYFKEE